MRLKILAISNKEGEEEPITDPVKLVQLVKVTDKCNFAECKAGRLDFFCSKTKVLVNSQR